jgi:hypothetical protein
MDDKTAATQVLADYYATFSTLDLQAILPYFHEPSFLMGAGNVAATSTHAALTAVLTPAIEGLLSKGYARSELTNLRLRQLSATTISASGIAVRYRTDGQELERGGVTYLLHKTDTGWKIAVLVAHDPDPG